MIERVAVSPASPFDSDPLLRDLIGARGPGVPD